MGKREFIQTERYWIFSSGSKPCYFLVRFRTSHAYITTCLHHKIKGLKGQKPTAEVQPLWTFEDAKCCSNFLQLDHINNTKLTGSHLYFHTSTQNITEKNWLWKELQTNTHTTHTHTQLQTQTCDSDYNHRAKQLLRR